MAGRDGSRVRESGSGSAHSEARGRRGLTNNDVAWVVCGFRSGPQNFRISIGNSKWSIKNHFHLDFWNP
jgi:hypothetical protein